MVTKAKERETLEKILNMIEEIGGDDSYVGQAFKGCYQIAISNIDNDFFDSMQDRAELAERKVTLLEKELHEAREALSSSDRANELLNKRLETCATNCATMANKIADRAKELHDQGETIRRQQEEIIRLKAECYDLMRKEQENDKD